MKVLLKVAVLVCLCARLATAQNVDELKPGTSRVDDPRHPPASSPDEAGPLSKWIGYKDKYGFNIIPWGYIRLSYETVANPKDYDYIGRYDGFVLNNARTGVDFSLGKQFSGRVSVEAATDVNDELNTPFGTVDVRLKDGYARWDPFDFIGAQGGQFKAPFNAEELRSTADLMFIDRAVGLEGVLVARGFQQPGLEVDRQLGVMLSPREAFALPADFGLSYFFMVGNGNGENQILNDNSKVAIYGRVEGYYADWVTLGAAGQWNKRTVGDPPNRFDENDAGWDVDLLINPGNFEFYFDFIQIQTDYPDVDVSDRTQEEFHVQAGYRFRAPWFFITPAYRYAWFNPWADGPNKIAGVDNQDYLLQYHTLGLRVGDLDLPISLYLNYTFTVERSPRELENNRFQVLAQVEF